MQNHISDYERFISKVKVGTPEECWEFTGGINSTGRGIFTYNGKSIHAHRMSYIFHCGLIPAGMWVLHHCDNGKCVNPHHLFLGSAKDNVQDCVSKGRKVTLRGEDDPKSKLNNEKVLKIIELYKSGKYYQHELGTMFGVSRSTILSILQGDNWKSVTKITEPLTYMYERGAWKHGR